MEYYQIIHVFNWPCISYVISSSIPFLEISETENRAREKWLVYLITEYREDQNTTIQVYLWIIILGILQQLNVKVQQRGNYYFNMTRRWSLKSNFKDKYFMIIFPI